MLLAQVDGAILSFTHLVADGLVAPPVQQALQGAQLAASIDVAGALPGSLQSQAAHPGRILLEHHVCNVPRPLQLLGVLAVLDEIHCMGNRPTPHLTEVMIDTVAMATMAETIKAWQHMADCLEPWWR